MGVEQSADGHWRRRQASESHDLGVTAAGLTRAAAQADDRTFYRAAALLQRAEAAPNRGEAAAMAQQALALMARAPAAVDLQVVVPQLALLGAWEGIVSLPLQASRTHLDRCTSRDQAADRSTRDRLLPSDTATPLAPPQMS